MTNQSESSPNTNRVEYIQIVGYPRPRKDEKPPENLPTSDSSEKTSTEEYLAKEFQTVKGLGFAVMFPPNRKKK